MSLSFYDACFLGQKDLVEWMISNGNEVYWDWGLYGACYGGREDIVNLIISKVNDVSKGNHIKGNDNGNGNGMPIHWSMGLCGACNGGHRKLINLMISKGATTNIDTLKVYNITTRSLGEHGLPLETLLTLDPELHQKVLTFRQCIQCDLSSFLLLDLVKVVKEYSLD